MPAAGEPKARANPAIPLIGALSLTAALVAALPGPSYADRDDDADRAREAYARIESFFEDIPEEESESRARRRAKAEEKVLEHAREVTGGDAPDLTEHVRNCSDCLQRRAEAARAEGIWAHAWLYGRAATRFRQHIERYPEAETADSARFHLGECLWQLGEAEKALDLWAEVTQASDVQIAALARVRLADHHLTENELEEALPHFRAGVTDSMDVDERLRCRLEVGRCLSILGRGKEAKRVLTDLAKEIPDGSTDRQREKLRIQAMAYLEYPPRGGKTLDAPRAIAWYERVYEEHRIIEEKTRKEKSPDARRVLLHRRDALADAIRLNLRDWDGIRHPKILYTLEVILSDARNPFGADVIPELIQIGSLDALEPVLRRLRIRQGTLRPQILDALAEHGVPAEESIVDRIFQDRKEIADVRAAAARTIALRDSAEAVTMLCGEIVEIPSGNPDGVRRGADPRIQMKRLNDGIRDALSGMESSEAIEALGEMARDRKAPVDRREVMSEALGRMERPEAVDALLPLLGDPTGRIASAAAGALGRSRDPRAAEALMKSLQGGPDDSTFVVGLLRGLDQLGPPEKGEDALIGLADASYEETRVLTHALLRQTGGDAGRARLAAALGDEVRDVRWHAIRAMGMGTPSVAIVSALIARLSEEKDVRLSYQLLKYLNRMTGARIGPDPEEWQRWWEAAKDSFDPSSIRLASPPTKEEGQRTVTRYFTLEITNKKVIFLLDTSGSMEAKITVPEGPMSTRRIRDKKINIAKRELIKVLKAFKRDTSYNIMPFATEYSALWERLHKATKGNTARAIQVVEGLSAQGGTNIFDTLMHALKDRKVEAIYLLSDGEPTSGAVTDPDEILKQVRALNGAREVKIHAIDLSGQSFFLNRLAKQNGGRYVSVLYWR